MYFFKKICLGKHPPKKKEFPVLKISTTLPGTAKNRGVWSFFLSLLNLSSFTRLHLGIISVCNLNNFQLLSAEESKYGIFMLSIVLCCFYSHVNFAN